MIDGCCSEDSSISPGRGLQRGVGHSLDIAAACQMQGAQNHAAPMAVSDHRNRAAGRQAGNHAGSVQAVELR